jgi:hypothetical protein
MKLQIDLENKTIKIDQPIKIKDFVKIVKDLRPKDWAEYTLEANAIISYWYNPISYWSPGTYCGGYVKTTTSNGSDIQFVSSGTKVDPTIPNTLTSNILNYEIQN